MVDVIYTLLKLARLDAGIIQMEKTPEDVYKRQGDACGLAWQDVNLEEQCLTIRRSIRYDGSRHKNRCV